MPLTKLQKLSQFGQSLWLDYISRSLIESEKLKSLIDLGLRGMTSNPTIFNQAVNAASDYDQKIFSLHTEGQSPFEIYDDLTIKDIQDATDLFRDLYEKTNRSDGYVSLEINPKLAMKTEESIAEGLRLFKKVNRPNVMIKVPSTEAGFPVIEELLSQGVSVNVTLVFSLEQYTKTAQAFLAGVKRLLDQGGDVKKIRSVASLFVSRIDTLVDQWLDEKMAADKDPALKNQLASLKGRAAVANARLMFEEFKTIFESKTFSSFAEKGAAPQRVLWASTGTKNPQYSDLKYVTELMCRPTVNTVPEKTLHAFLDHGEVREASWNSQEPQEFLEELKRCGLDIREVCQKLLEDGVAAFEKSFDELLHSIEHKAQQLSVVPR